MSMDQMDDDIPPHQEPYGFMERELAFKLLASHAMVDAEYFDWLRKDPVGAAAQLHIGLTDRDVEYLLNEVEWDRIAEMAEPIRESLHLELVTNSW
jgi:hypothetical protein